MDIINPRIIKETSSGYSFVSIETDMFENRELCCFGDICSEMADALTSQIRYLNRLDPKAEITLYIDSPGGEVNSGMAIYDAMQLSSAPIKTVCVGLAASMAAVLFIAGDVREIYPHSRIMIHDPLIASTGGSALRLKSISDSLMETRNLTAEIISEHSGIPIEEVLRITSYDAWFNASLALGWGLADKICVSSKKKRKKPIPPAIKKMKARAKAEAKEAAVK